MLPVLGQQHLPEKLLSSHQEGITAEEGAFLHALNPTRKSVSSK